MEPQDEESMASTALQGIKAACLRPLPSERPAFQQIASHCRSVLEVCAPGPLLRFVGEAPSQFGTCCMVMLVGQCETCSLCLCRCRVQKAQRCLPHPPSF